MKILRDGDDVFAFGILPLRDEIYRFLMAELGDGFFEVLFNCESTLLSIKEIKERFQPYYEGLVRIHEDVSLNGESYLPVSFYDSYDYSGAKRISNKIQCSLLVRSLIDLIDPHYKFGCRKVES